MRLMSSHPVAGQETLSHQVTSALVEGLAYVIPALDRWTATTWLVDVTPGFSALAPIAAQAVIYTMLIAAATLFDFHRRSL